MDQLGFAVPYKKELPKIQVLSRKRKMPGSCVKECLHTPPLPMRVTAHKALNVRNMHGTSAAREADIHSKDRDEEPVEASCATECTALKLHQ